MHVLILGTRGVPARHGGFETFAQDLSLFLVARGHDATVYCQTKAGSGIQEDMWNGVRRVFVPSPDHPLGTLLFDWIATKHSSALDGVVLTLGYNTGVFNFLYRLRDVPNIMNMDGIEWKRAKWSLPHRAWLWFNEWAGARAANRLIADHPEVFKHLSRHTSPNKITVIQYGAERISSISTSPLQHYGLRAKDYDIVIARPEPENSILEIVRAWSLRTRNRPLVVLGDYRPNDISYHKEVLEAASAEVIFTGAIYNSEVVMSLRFHARTYIHGHQVGGTNPSLVEALAAGNAVIAHDNRFTHWVAGEGARYFETMEHLGEILDSLQADPSQLTTMEEASRRRHWEEFTQERVLLAYESLLLQFVQPEKATAAALVGAETT
jgi:glycosyltransferase involved in cell wall biosynthesis